MSVSSNCPTREQLAKYLLGDLSELGLGAVENHLANCHVCDEAVTSMDGIADTIVVGLRRPQPEDRYLLEPEYSRALTRLRVLQIALPSLDHEDDIKQGQTSTALKQLGEYELLEKLGEGGMGAVYKARQMRLRKIVALKVLPGHRMQDAQAVGRFQREMQAVGQLNHPNIIQAHDAREIDGVHCLVVEYIQGHDVSELVRRCGRLSVADACEVVRQAALGLQYAHERGLVHRDIKPSNLMLARDGQVKILDLGLALLRTESLDSQEMTASGQIMGTADYMAPEQVSDSHNVDIRADIYSLGCTLYMLLTGCSPFHGPAYESDFDKMTGHVRDLAPPIRDHRGDVPDGLVVVLDRMLAKDPAHRFTTPAEVAEAIAPMAADCDLAGLFGKRNETLARPPKRDNSLPSTYGPRSSALVSTQPSHEPKLRSVRHSGRRRWGLWVVVFGVSTVAAVLVAGIAIRLATERGDIVIHSEIPGVQVSITRQGREIDQFLLDEGQKTVTVRSGRYEIALVGVNADALRVDNERFTLSRGDKQIVKVFRPVQPRQTSDRYIPSRTLPPQGASGTAVKVDNERASKKERFSRGWDLIHQNPPDFQTALDLLEQNIREFPNATDVDYDYGWAMVCCANLGEYEKAYQYYRTIRIRFAGMLKTGAGGAMRSWDDRAADVRLRVRSSTDPEAKRIYEKMMELERELEKERE